MASFLQFTMTQSLLLIPPLCFFYYLFTAFAAYRRLRRFPGPRFASFSYLPMLRIESSGRAVDIYQELHRKYGRTVRIGPNDLITWDSDLIRSLSAPRSPHGRSDWYAATTPDPFFDTMGSTLDKGKHDSLKSKTAAGYAGRDSPMLEQGIDETVEALLGLIRRKYLSEDGGGEESSVDNGPGGSLRPLDFGKVAQYFTLDALTQVGLSTPFGFLETDGDVNGYVQTVTDMMATMPSVASVPWLNKIALSSTVQHLIGPKETDETGVGKMLNVCKNIASTRYGPDAKHKKDMLGSFVRLGLNQREAQAETFLAFVAGSDTTATAIRATLLHIITAPNVYQRLKAEIDAASAEGALSRPVVKLTEAQQLPYLQAVIWEGLRIHPPFTGLVMKQVGPPGATLEGLPVPAGTRISHSTWRMMRDSAVFGADADVFRPERWLCSDPATRAAMKRHTELVFGAGRWGCAGKQLAFMELNKVFLELLLAFDIQLVNPQKPWKSLNYMIFLQTEMYLRVSER